jgi:hypothetical protein
MNTPASAQTSAWADGEARTGGAAMAAAAKTVAAIFFFTGQIIVAWPLNR